MDIKNVAYSGIEGSFASIAVAKIFGDVTTNPLDNFKEAYEAVVNGESDVAVLPMENSFAGEVSQVTDLMFSGPLVVDGVYELAVAQCLLGVEGSTVDSIKKVYSHPQAIAQCDTFLQEHSIKSKDYDNTAVAARAVAKLNDVSIGAIASERAASLYGLKLLQKDINESSINVTRFAVLKRPENVTQSNPNSNVHILMFTVEHAAGTLAKAISVIGEYGYNMQVIRSRPLGNVNWQYYFYVEITGDLDTSDGEKMVEKMNQVCSTFKIVGSYEFGKKL